MSFHRLKLPLTALGLLGALSSVRLTHPPAPAGLDPEGRLPPGTRILGLAIGGMTQAEARRRLARDGPLQPEAPVRFELGGLGWTLPARALAPEWRLEAALTAAQDGRASRPTYAWQRLLGLGREASPGVPVRLPAARLRRALRPLAEHVQASSRGTRQLDFRQARAATEAALGGLPPYRVALTTVPGSPSAPGLAVLAQPPPRPALGRGRVVLAAVGDVLLDKTDPDPLAGIAEALGRADLVFANLEIPLSRRGAPAACKDAADLAAGREFLFRGPPEGAALLARAGVSVVSLANNHALDYGPLALRDTLTSLHAAGLATCGAGQDDLEAHGPAVVTTNGAAVAFLGYVLASALPPEHDWAATPSRSGLAVLDDSSGHVSLESRQTLVADVCRAAARADRVVVSLHGGAEGSALPTPAQREVAREAEAAGASVLIGHHPHVLQPAVFVGNLAAVFSLGNCVFPVPTGRDDQRQSAIAYIELGEAEASVRLLPVTLRAGRPHEAGADPLACQAVRRQITPRSPSPDA